MITLSGDNQANMIEDVNSLSRYIDDLLKLTFLISKLWSVNFFHLNCS